MPADPRLAPERPRCRFCGAPLDRLKARLHGDVCDLAACRGQLAREKADETAQRQWTETLRRSREQIRDAAAEVIAGARTLGLSTDQVVPVAVPLLDRPMVPIGPEDRALITGHIARIVAESFETDFPDEIIRDRDDLEAPVDPYVGAACTTCRGACCEVGRSYLAFLTAETVSQYRRHVPDRTPDQVRESYLDRLPERIVEGSCYFHGAQGCALDREQRDNVCHKHLCHQIRVQREAGVTDGPGPFVIVAADQHGNRAVTLHDPLEGLRPLPGEPRAAPDAAEAERIAELAMAPFPPAPPSGRPAAPPPSPVCAWCRRPIAQARAAMGGSCGDPACERRRMSDEARHRPSGGETSR